MSDHLPKDALLFVPLGGAGEIGMNLSLYGHAGRWLMVDCGLTFADETMPGIELLVPDPAWIADRHADLVGLVLTHAHEDHLGAVAYLWPQLRCPVYATAFTAAVLRRKLDEADLLDEVPLRVFVPGEVLDLGPFRIQPVSITHSIPESQFLAIDTPLGRVLHSGDWKLDPNPLVGPLTDTAALQNLGRAGVLALICDSTNVFRHGESGSEAAVRNSLIDLLVDRPGRIAVTTFASNIARIETVARVAQATGRHLCLVGRSLWRFSETARASGYLSDVEPFLTERDVGYLPRDKVLLLCTGCQGEPRGAMARIAAGDHPHIALTAGDLAVFSSRIIPGNERDLGKMHNQLATRGIEVITEREAFVHVSGHPARDELAQMYRWIRPGIAVPVHGEARHLIEHARLAASLGVERTLIARNGSVIRLAPGEPEVIAEVPSGRLAVDGEMLVAPAGPVMTARRKLAYNGAAFVAVALDGAGLPIGRPQVSLRGIAEDEDGALGERVLATVLAALDRLSDRALADDEDVAEAVRQAVRRAVRSVCDRRPVIEVHVVRPGGPMKAGRARAGREWAK